MIKLFAVHMPESVKEPLLKTLFSGHIGQGAMADRFEKEFAAKFGIQHAVAVSSGTAALRLALALAGVGPGDEVISTPYTMVATNTAILEQFARPVFADIQYQTINLDPQDIERHISPKTKVIMCVHWGGYPCDMDEIRQVAAAHGLPVIEDAAHAPGASYRGRAIGTISEFTTFSFQAIKHITTGDGGMLAIASREKYQEALRRRWFGIDRAARKPSVLGHDPEYDITETGYKYHMNDIAATIGVEQLKYFDRLFQRRAQIADRYRLELVNIPGISLLENRADRVHANWMFAIHVARRTEFAGWMHSRGIEVAVHNWRNDKYSVFGGLRKDLPNLKRANDTLINIPLHGELTDPDVECVIEAIKEFGGR